jgi:hypothetical protein
MKQIDFAFTGFLVILGDEEGECRFFSCDNKGEVFKVLTDNIHNEIDY